MKSSTLITAVLVAVITSFIWWWCKKCPPCPAPEPHTACDTCFCATTPLQDADSNWCCGDRLTKQCVPDSDRFCTDGQVAGYGNCDIKIDKMIMTRGEDRITTDIYISNSSDDDASCAKLEVLLPVESKFMEFNNVDGLSKEWQFYDGYVRVNLGQLSTSGGTSPTRHVQMVTSLNCRDSITSGIAAFVYSIVPDRCLINNYAYGYYQTTGLGEWCNAPVVKALAEVNGK